MLHKMFLAVLAFFLVAVVLQGCGGCDEDAYAKCTTPAYADGVCSTFSKCIKDADCCDHEANGAKVKDAVAALCTASKAAVSDNSQNHCNH